MTTAYIERDCVFTFEGQSFEAGGAVVTDDLIVVYLSPENRVTNWHGDALGTYRVTASWKTPRSFVSSTMWQVRVTLTDGRVYSGRSAGVGMICRAKRVAK